MKHLEDLKEGVRLEGLITDEVVKIEKVEDYGKNAKKIIYSMKNKGVDERIITEEGMQKLIFFEGEEKKEFTADPHLFELASESYRINLAHLFDPYFAVKSSLIEPYPHQISAVYEKMLPAKPFLRFLLADDPGAGKTIMSGLLIKELIIREDLKRCLIVVPGGLDIQWQRELIEKFALHFEILAKSDFENRNNLFCKNEYHYIVRLDMLSRNEDYKKHLRKIEQPLDLIICDEAHKMSAHYRSGNKTDFTKRFRLGELLAEKCKHFLLLTATPHNGYNEDFDIFMSLLDKDRFYGITKKPRSYYIKDIMRRLTKEQLVTFGGKKLLPDRTSYTIKYDLSDSEKILYLDVTKYVREGMNRAEKLIKKRQNLVFFALQLLQRRLASSPEAIYVSIKRRKERLQKLKKEIDKEIDKENALNSNLSDVIKFYGEEKIETLSIDEQYGDEIENRLYELMDKATSAGNIPELDQEIDELQKLENTALHIKKEGIDRKWNELSEIFNQPIIKESDGSYRKIVIFTESVDTLKYLRERILKITGEGSVFAIYGEIKDKERRIVMDKFLHDKSVIVLLATDAAGEGINLHSANLMVNYDLPWNPNRIEQRFGRIHRIGQEEECYLYNLVAADTCESRVYIRLLEKLNNIWKSLDVPGHDLLGKIHNEFPLRELIINEIRFHHSDTKNKKPEQEQLVFDLEKIKLLAQNSFIKDTLDLSEIENIHQDIQLRNAQRLQPHYIKNFFIKSFKKLGGTINYKKEEGYYILDKIPQEVTQGVSVIGNYGNYEKIFFDKEKIISLPQEEQNKSVLLTSGQSLFDKTRELIFKRYESLLLEGTIFLDKLSKKNDLRVAIYLEHKIQHEFKEPKSNSNQKLSCRLYFLEVYKDERILDVGTAPYLLYDPLNIAEHRDSIKGINTLSWKSIESRVKDYVIQNIYEQHLKEIREPRLEEINRKEEEITERLSLQIANQKENAEKLDIEEMSKKKFDSNSTSKNLSNSVPELEERLKKCLKNLSLQRNITALNHAIVGCSLIVPEELLNEFENKSNSVDIEARRSIEKLAMNSVMQIEKTIGREPEDVSDQRGIGYDIKSLNKEEKETFFIEVKGLSTEQPKVTLTRNEIYCALNQGKKFRLALVRIKKGKVEGIKYILGEWGEKIFGKSGINQKSSTFDANKIWKLGVEPQ